MMTRIAGHDGQKIGDASARLIRPEPRRRIRRVGLQAVWQQIAVVRKVRSSVGWHGQTARKRCIQVSVRVRLDGSARLIRGEPGNLPSVDGALEELRAMNEFRQVPHIGQVEQLGVIVSERPVIVSQIEWIDDTAVSSTVVSLTVTNAENFAEGVVGQERDRTGLLLP